MADFSPLDDDPLLADVASAVLAGEVVDWDAADGAADPGTRRLVTQLREVSRVSEFYRRIHAGASPAPPLTCGAMWAHLRIDGLIGAGAYGEVYRAWDTRLGRHVALKLLGADSLPVGHDATTVIAEAHRLARVRHPHVVTIHGAERLGDRVGLWMELIAGETLGTWLARRGPLPSREVMRVGRDLASALQAVHDADLVHGDVKAQNVMREDSGRVVLMDFGAGTDLREGRGTGSHGAWTPIYAAPEILRGGAATAQSDVYSLGVLLHLLATGRYPSGARSVEALREATQQRQALRWPDDVAPALRRAVQHALDPIPASRPSCAEMAEALAVHGPAQLSRRVALGAALTGLTGLGLMVVSRAGPGTSPVADPPAGLEGMQRVPVPAHRVIGRPARRHTTVPYSDADGNLCLLDLGTMTSTLLARAGGGGIAEFTAASDDGRVVACQWILPGGQAELRLFGSAGTTYRVLLPAGQRRDPVPLGWASDGRALLVLSHAEDGARLMEVVDVGTGMATLVRRFTRAVPYGASLSPDGRFVAYDDVDEATGVRDVHVTRVGGDDGWPVTSHGATDASPEWTPDGAGLVFTSDRAGSNDLWLQPMRHGRPVGPAHVAFRHLGRVSPLGFAGGDTFYYLAQTSTIDACEATLDPRTWRVGPVRALSRRYEGTCAKPVWSPDGRRLAYIAMRGPIRGDRGGHVLVIRDTVTGQERECAQTLAFHLPHLSWSRDSAQVLMRGSDARLVPALYLVDAASGALTRALPRATVANAYAEFDATGRHVLYVHPVRGLVAHEVGSGEERIRLAHRASGLVQVLRFAQAHRTGMLGYSGWLPGNERTSLRLVDAAGQVRELVRSDPGEMLVAQCWTPDGLYLLFTRYMVRSGSPHALWRAPADGERPAPLGLEIRGWTQANPITMHPDGSAIGFTSGDVSWEVSRLVHFLAPPQGAPRF